VRAAVFQLSLAWFFVAVTTRERSEEISRAIIIIVRVGAEGMSFRLRRAARGVIFPADVRERRYAQRVKRSTLMKLTSNAIYALNPQYPSSDIAYPQESISPNERELTERTANGAESENDWIS